MQVLSSTAFLDLWERGSRLHPLDRALLAASVALPGSPADAPADWPLGKRNKLLLQLHFGSFGSSLQGWASCTGCGEKMEFEMDAQTLLSPKADEPRPDSTVVVKGHAFRLPNSRDLSIAARETDSIAAALSLLQSCSLEPPPLPEISIEEMEEVGEQLALADPLAEIRVTLQCPACNEQRVEMLDLSSFVWAEIEARARRLLWEVHTLASAYGWSEGEVLSLTAARRARYLEMVQA
jgi:hypothetical protein